VVTRRPAPEPGRYDPQRVAHLQPIHDAVSRLGLPLIRFRKIKSILGALEVQIEDGGDAAEVNGLLLNALRAVLRHQVGDTQMREALAAIDAVAHAEALRWEQVRAGPLRAQDVTPDERLDDLMQEGYQLLAAGQRTAACDRWLEAWTLVTQLAAPEMRTASAFDQAHPLVQSVANWCPDLEMELGNAGLDNPAYNAHWLRYARAFLTHFPGSDSDSWINATRAEGEALWRLGRQREAETVYAALVERFPREAWAYIGWADQYWLLKESPKAYAPAAAILQRALKQPDLHDRRDVLERLADLYGEWGKPQEQAAVVTHLARAADRRGTRPGGPSPAAVGGQPGSRAEKPGRNAPCWCGSGRKYKLCHLDPDRHGT